MKQKKNMHNDVTAYAESLGYSVEHRPTKDLLAFSKDGFHLMLNGSGHECGKKPYNLRILTPYLRNPQSLLYPDGQNDSFSEEPHICPAHTPIIEALLEELPVFKLDAYDKPVITARKLMSKVMKELLPKEEVFSQYGISVHVRYRVGWYSLYVGIEGSGWYNSVILRTKIGASPIYRELEATKKAGEYLPAEYTTYHFRNEPLYDLQREDVWQLSDQVIAALLDSIQK
jgi:hypothetical protein